ncbi:hypothetical protein JCM6882_001485 [Rhodosporidiobolus microsporus]
MAVSGDTQVISYAPSPSDERFKPVSSLKKDEKILVLKGGKMKVATVVAIKTSKNVLYDIKPARRDAFRVTKAHPFSLEGASTTWIAGKSDSLTRFSSRPTADAVSSHLPAAVVEAVKVKGKHEFQCGSFRSAIQHAVAFRLHGPDLPPKVTQKFHGVVTATSGIKLLNKNSWEVKIQVKNDETKKFEDKRKTFTWRNPEKIDPAFDFLADREGKVECQSREQALRMAVTFNQKILRPHLDFTGVDFQEQASDAIGMYNRHVLGIDGQRRPVYPSISSANGIGLNLMVRNGTLTIQSLYETKNRSTVRHFFIGPELEVEAYTTSGQKLYKVPDLSTDNFDFPSFAASIDKDLDSAPVWKPPVATHSLETLVQLPEQERGSWGFRRPDQLKYPGTPVPTKNLLLPSWLHTALGGDGDRRTGHLINNHQEEVLKELQKIASKLGGSLVYLGGLAYGIYKVKGDDPRIIKDLDEHLLAHAGEAKKSISVAPVVGQENVWHGREGTLIYELTGPTNADEAEEMFLDIKQAIKLEKGEKSASSSSSSSFRGGRSDDDSTSESSDSDQDDEFANDDDSGVEVSPAPKKAKRGKNLVRPLLKKLDQLPKKGETGAAADQKHVHPDYLRASKAELEKLLAGAFDTDAHLKNTPTSTSFVFSQSLKWHKRLFEDIQLVAAMCGHGVRSYRRPAQPYRILDAVRNVIHEGMGHETMVLVVTRNLDKIPTVLKYKRATNKDKSEKDDFGFYALKRFSPGVEIETVYDVQLKEGDVDILRPDLLTFKPASPAKEPVPRASSNGEVDASALLPEWQHPHYAPKRGDGDEELDADAEEGDEGSGGGEGMEVDSDAAAEEEDDDDDAPSNGQNVTPAFANQIRGFKRPASPPPSSRGKKRKGASVPGFGSELDAYLSRISSSSTTAQAQAGPGPASSSAAAAAAQQQQHEEEGGKETTSSSDRLKAFLCRPRVAEE